MVQFQANTDKVVNEFTQFSIDDQLALLWFVYEKMGQGVTPAAPDASTASPGIAEGLFNQVKEKPQEEQLQIMRDIARGNSTEMSRQYGSLSATTKLDFWYLLAQGMDQGTIIPMPENYQVSQQGNDWLKALEGLEFQQQITVLRSIASNMGAEPASGAAI
ncbi:orange carotenoid protein N-terminal domain-containing protein [Gloeothece verrucosa]|uniref:Orange carotenoid protein n=1 Tax=Gloeothece verrucosa (strain PCC 7822) TaxID=497965 RepID=E0U9E6_GLOV7|nr:orange carotenoid protein N-terminal domain-containing protein [Gloeothece verrucosa]ADN12638.1 Orange carotenoid protein [Gloeothece verrucosa PCC 7822]